ncbi:MAG: hypothetical protein KQA34_00475 [Candidatus Aenigmarchaeota archaeon]|nr:hypothetical protein [Candidatus Aenigmarchaeota archaeon]
MRHKVISAYVATIIILLLTVGIGLGLYLYFSGYLGGLTGTVETTQQQITECLGAKLDVDYYIDGNELRVIAVNTGKIELKGNFSIRVEDDRGIVRYFINETSSLLPGQFLEHTIDITQYFSGSESIVKVTVQPLGNCQIPFSKVKEIKIQVSGEVVRDRAA